ncbi:MAG: PCYCGC motif-containing (lipo)protein [Candidatus Hydrothermarchaeales archaeon]
MGKRKRYRKEARKEPEERPINTKALLVVALLVVGVGIYVIGGRSSDEGSKTATQLYIELPDYAYVNDRTLKAYTIATQIPEVLEKMPCYCSCVRIGHKSLKNCFISDNEGYAEHGAHCDLCVSEALDVDRWRDSGLSLKDMRSRIDEKYGGGRFGEPTDTPPV